MKTEKTFWDVEQQEYTTIEWNKIATEIAQDEKIDRQDPNYKEICDILGW